MFVFECVDWVWMGGFVCLFLTMRVHVQVGMAGCGRVYKK